MVLIGTAVLMCFEGFFIFFVLTFNLQICHNRFVSCSLPFLLRLFHLQVVIS